MKKFFLNYNSGYTIKIFSVEYFFMVFLVLLLLILIIKNKEKFTNMSKNSKKKLRIAFGIVLLINLILRRGSAIYYNVYDWRYDLDLGVCNFNSILMMIYCFTGSKQIYKISFYLTFVGPLNSILLPCMNLNPLNYSCYSFIIIHHLLFVFNVIFMYNEGIHYRKKEFVLFCIFIFIYLIITFRMNSLYNIAYNLPEAFVHNTLKNKGVIYAILSNKALTFAVFLGYIYVFSNIGKLFLKNFNKSKKTYGASV